MALSPAFIIAPGTDVSGYTLTDTSTGSDGAIASRRIYNQTSIGTYIVPTGTITDYIPFPLSDGSSISVTEMLTVDYALSITVQWLDASNNVLYTLTQSFCFVGNDEQFMYGIVQGVSANNSILQNRNFILNCFRLAMFTTYAQKAVETGNDIYSSQILLSSAQGMINKSSAYFFIWQ
jgi:hypothetical protein